MTNYESRDYLIPIHTSDHKTLYFSKNILINRCQKIEMLDKHNQYQELNMPFISSVLVNFFEFIEFDKLPDLQSFAILADYVQYTNHGLIMNKSNLIDFLIQQYECSDFIYFYKYVKEHDLIPKELNESSVEELFLSIKPFEHSKIKKQKIDWLDIANVFQAPELLKELYISLVSQFNTINETKDKYYYACCQENNEDISYENALQRYNNYLDIFNGFRKKYVYNFKPLSKGPYPVFS